MFPLSIQMPAIAATDENTFAERLKILNTHKFSGCELQILDFEKDNVAKIKSYTTEFNLQITRIATGALASRDKLYLSDSGEAGKNAVSLMKKFIRSIWFNTPLLAAAVINLA